MAPHWRGLQPGISWMPLRLAGACALSWLHSSRAHSRPLLLLAGRQPRIAGRHTSAPLLLPTQTWRQPLEIALARLRRQAWQAAVRERLPEAAASLPALEMECEAGPLKA